MRLWALDQLYAIAFSKPEQYVRCTGLNGPWWESARTWESVSLSLRIYDIDIRNRICKSLHKVLMTPQPGPASTHIGQTPWAIVIERRQDLIIKARVDYWWVCKLCKLRGSQDLHSDIDTWYDCVFPPAHSRRKNPRSRGWRNHGDHKSCHRGSDQWSCHTRVRLSWGLNYISTLCLFR